MPYKSYFTSPESVKEQWQLADHEAKTIWELWDMAWGELQVSLNNKEVAEFIGDTRGYYTQKLGVYDDPDTMAKLTSATVTISEDALSRLVNIQGILQMMRSFYTGGHKEIFRLVWRGILKRVNGDEDKAKQIAQAFNKTYAPDEQLHYLQYLIGKSNKNWLAQKPYVVPGKKQGTFTLHVWGK